MCHPTWDPGWAPPITSVPAHPISHELSRARTVSGAPSSPTPRALPSPTSRLPRNCRFTCSRSAEAPAAPRASRPRRRPAVPAQLAPPPLLPPVPPPLRPEAAAPRFAGRRRRRSRRHLRLGGLPQQSPHRVPLPRASTHPRRESAASCAALGIHRASRMGGDSLPRLDSRGGNSLPGVTGTGGGDSPEGMTRWAGIPPSKPLSQQGVSPREPAVLERRLQKPGILGGKDPGRGQLRISIQAGLGAPSRWKSVS